MALFGHNESPWPIKAIAEVILICGVAALVFLGTRLQPVNKHLAHAIWGLMALFFLAFLRHGMDIVSGTKPIPFINALILSGFLILLRILLYWKFGKKGQEQALP